MQKIKFTLLSLFIISLYSCDNNEDVNLNLLQEYNFKYTSSISYPDDITKIDTIIYSFISEDSVVAFRKFYEATALEEPELVSQDTIGRDYFTNVNMVYSGFFSEQFVMYDSDYLLDLSWKVLTLDEDQLNIKLYSGDLYAGNVKLETLTKL